MTEEEVDHAIEADMRQREERFRAYMIEIGRPDLLAEYDAKQREYRLGIYSAKMTWHSISPAQRRALLDTERHGGRLTREGKEYRHRDRHQPYRPIRIATVRNLAARELLAWDGGAFDPEGSAVLTEHGQFVVKIAAEPS